MNRRRLTARASWFLACGPALLAACGGGGGGGSSAAIPTALELAPSTDTLAAGLVRQFSAVARLSDGTQDDVTANATWSSDAPAVASVGNGAEAGRVVAFAAGDAHVRAEWSGLQVEALVSVTPPVATGVIVEPDVLGLPLAVEFPLAATGTFTDGSTRDVTSECAWASGDVAVVEVGTGAADAGVLRSLAVGTTSVSATLDGQVATTDVFVLPVDALQRDVQSGASLSAPHVAFGPAGRLDAAWSHAFRNPGELWLAGFDPASGWGAPEHYDTSGVGDRVFGPRIATTAGGDSWLAWSGQAGVYAARRPAGGSFSAPAVIDSGANPFLAFAEGLGLAPDAAGGTLLVWRTPNADAIQHARFVPPSGWTAATPVRVPPAQTQISGIGLVSNANGVAFLIWVEGSVMAGWDLQVARFDPLAGFGAPHLLASAPVPSSFGLALNESGAALAAWTEEGTFQPRTLFAARFVPGSGWLAPDPVSPGGPSLGPTDPGAAISKNGNAFVTWRNAGDFDVVGNRFVAGAWQGAEVVVDLTNGDPAVFAPFVDDAGNAVAFWVRFRQIPTVHSRRRHPAFGWQPERVLDFLGFSGGPSRLSLVTAPEGRAVLSWIETSPQLEHAYTHRFQLP